ncbi:hypothetical protein EJ02DRAFT_471385 [Clathrospora elynae]|uniref:Uncharacterized protein n=1 Tax=Clathrospora elynae TaxID=706981 RepID=A0A6A5S623_9PLEO|nr:hypothetical protein EJ02DRAFT_471385 [Clathrospora elynae]
MLAHLVPITTAASSCTSISAPSIWLVTMRSTALFLQGGAAKLSPPAAASSGRSPPKGPLNNKMDHVYQTFESGLFYDPEDIGEIFIASGAGGLPPQTGCTDYHGTVSPRSSGSTLGGQANPLAQTVGSPSNHDANASSFDLMSIQASATPVNASAVCYHFAVPHGGARSPTPSHDNSRKLLYMSINSPLAGKGKGKGKGRGRK